MDYEALLADKLGLFSADEARAELYNSNNTTTGNDNNGQHTQQSNRMRYRLEEDGDSNDNDSGLGMRVDAVGKMAMTKEGRGNRESDGGT